MRSIKAQYFICFAVMGAVMPFLSIYLKEDQGLTESQIGYIVAAASLSVLVTPVFITLLADTRLDPRRVSGICFLLSGSFLLAMGLFEGFWPALVFFSLHSLAYVALLPLQDGMNFSFQRKRETNGQPPEPYHRIRVWGTIGFIIPSLIIFFLIEGGSSTSIILAVAFVFSLAGLVNCALMPDPRRDNKPPAAGEQAGLPTLGAARALFTENALIFCLGMALAHAASSAYFAFYPLYLTEEIGLDRKWAGLIFNIGVAIEIVFILSLGHMIRRLGLRRLIVLGMFCMALRTALLALVPTVGVAIAGQILHGLIIIAMHVGPVMYINRLASDRYRNSIQGLYTMTVVGGSRIIGSILAGHLAQTNLLLLFGIATLVTLVTLVLFLIAFQPEESDHSPL